MKTVVEKINDGTDNTVVEFEVGGIGLSFEVGDMMLVKDFSGYSYVGFAECMSGVIGSGNETLIMSSNRPSTDDYPNIEIAVSEIKNAEELLEQE